MTGVHDGRIGCERGAWAGRAPITDLVQLWKAQLDGVDQGWHKPAGWHLGKRLQNNKSSDWHGFVPAIPTVTLQHRIETQQSSLDPRKNEGSLELVRVTCSLMKTLTNVEVQISRFNKAQQVVGALAS